MASNTLALKSSLRISSLSRSVSSVSKVFQSAQKTTTSIATSIAKQNEIKKKSISDSAKFFLARRDAVRRKEQEGIIEASGIVGTVKRTGKVVMDSTKGFLGRILDFVGTLLVGWLIINLPKIIEGAKKLIERVNKLIGIMLNVIGDISLFMTGFGELLGGVLVDVLKFDFTGTQRTVEDSVGKMTDAMRKLERDVFNGIRLLTMPLDFGFGQIYGDTAPKGQSGGYSEPSDQIKGGVISPQAVYQYLRYKGLSHAQAMGILANIDGESSFRVGAKSGDDGGAGGLFQWKKPRSDRMAKAVPDWETNWKGQLDYALVERGEPGPAYIRTDFQSPEQAAEWWMVNWERPAHSVRGARTRKHNAFIDRFVPPQAGRATSFNVPNVGSTAALAEGTNLKPSIAAGNVGYVKVSDEFGSRGGGHLGLDIAAPAGTYIALRLDCEVVGTRYQRDGYGYVIDVWVPKLSVQLRFGHCQNIMIKSGKIAAGKSFATVGSTGRSSGPHIHFEYSKTYDKTSYGSDSDPSPYVPFILLTSYHSNPEATTAARTKATVNTAQISAGVSKSPDNLTKERQGDEVVIMGPKPKEEEVVASPIFTGGFNIPGGDEVNRFIKDISFFKLGFN